MLSIAVYIHAFMQSSYGTCVRLTNTCVTAWQVLPLLTPAPATAAAQLLLKLYPLQQPLLSRHATDALGALVSGPGTTSISAGSIAALLDAVLAAQGQAGERQGADVSLAVIKLLEGGLPRSAVEHPALQNAAWARCRTLETICLFRVGYLRCDGAILIKGHHEQSSWLTVTCKREPVPEICTPELPTSTEVLTNFTSIHDSTSGRYEST